MNDKLIISQALLELAKNSVTSFLDTGEEDKEIIEAAQKIGIVLPSPDLIVMKTIYAEIDKVNLNGVILPKKAVEKGLPTLIGKQCNWEHEGAGFVCGYTISAKINKDKIETINVLFKSLFPKQVNELIEKVKTKEAAVSFEIWNIDPETKKSVVKNLNNGFKEISPIICHGTGVLLVNPPACPNAKIFKVVAKEEIKFSEELCFATLAIEKSECKHCNNCENHKEEIVEIPKEIIEKVEAKAQEETKIEESKKRLCPECKHPMKEDEELCAECKKKKEEASKEVKPAEEIKAEVKAEDIKPEEKKEEVKPEEAKEEPIKEEEQKPLEPAQVTIPAVEQKPDEQAQVAEAPVNPKKLVKIVRYSTEINEETLTEAGSTFVRLGKEKVVRIYDDNTEDIEERDIQLVERFTQAQLEEAVNKAKEELITLHKAELEAKTNEVKVDLEKKIQEKETEIANLKKEKEIATAKEEETTPPTLEVGDVSQKDNNYYKERQERLNLKAYGKKKGE